MKNDVFNALSKKTDNRPVSAVNSLTEMFGIKVEIKITTISISKLKEKANHPFKVIKDDSLFALSRSIKENGLMEPIIVRPVGDNYEILSGHRRTMAVSLNKGTEIKAIVVNADDELANRIMISTNFEQREGYLPSEIAKSYLIRYNDLKHSRRLNDENSTGWNLQNIDKVMEKEFCTSKSKIYMYLRLNYLTQVMLDALDEKLLNLKIAVEISYLKESEQMHIYNIVYAAKKYKLDLKKATLIKKESAQRTLDESDIIVLLEEGINNKKPASISFSKNELQKYQSKFKDYDDMKKAILDFLENY